MRTRASRFLTACIFAGVPAMAAAQDFAIQSANGDYRLQFGFLAQMDTRVAIADTQNHVVDTFTIRRIRPVLRGRAAKYFEFYLNPDFAGGVVTVFDAYVDTRFSSALTVRVGKNKAPFGLERLQSAPYAMFVERSFPSIVAPNRDVGIQALGGIGGGALTYQAGVFNGVADGASAEADTNDSKDVAGRVVAHPFIRRADVLSGLALAFAASSGRQPAGLPSFVTTGRATFFSYDAGSTGEGVRHRVSPQWSYSYRAFGTFGEYVRSAGAVTRGARSARVTHEATTVTVSAVLTGEAASDQGVRPRKPFDPAQHTWGALQVAARYHTLRVDPGATGFTAATASREARAFGLGANWYLNPYVRWTADFERTTFEGNAGPPRPAENVFVVRSQLAF